MGLTWCHPGLKDLNSRLNQTFLSIILVKHLNSRMWRTIFIWMNLLRCLSNAKFLDSNHYFMIQNAIREHFVPTLWCGVRNIAPYSNPGAVSAFYPHLDTCCKNHDKCPVFVGRGECDYGVCNPSRLTPILSCECENEFQNCLKSLPPASFSAEIPITWIERLQADLTGFGYFEVMPFIKGETKCLLPIDNERMGLSKFKTESAKQWFRGESYLKDATNPDLVERQLARQLTLRINQYIKSAVNHFRNKFNWN